MRPAVMPEIRVLFTHGNSARWYCRTLARTKGLRVPRPMAGLSSRRPMRTWQVVRMTMANAHVTSSDCGPAEAVSEEPYGLERALTAAISHVRRGDSRPVVFSGPAGVGKLTCALALAARLGRPVAVFEVAVSGLRVGPPHGLRELPLIPRRIPQPTTARSCGAPVIIVDRPERLPGGQAGSLMAGLVYIATKRFPEALAHYFGVESRAAETSFVFTTRSGYFFPLSPSLFILTLHGYCRAEKEAIAVGLFAAAGRRLPAALVKSLVQRYAKSPGVGEIAALLQKTRELRDDEMTFARTVSAVAGEPAPSVLAHYATPLPGQAIAMGWTNEGGTHLVFEACFGSERDGDLKVLGMLGDAMFGAAEAALHVVNQSLTDPALRLGAGNGRPVLLNLPGSWTHKKEGRSAGLAIALAMYGLATGRTPHPHRAATGELSLGGLVLPVGTCMGKLLAAESEGMTDVIMPRGSVHELREASARLLETTRVWLVEAFSEAVDLWFQ